jgi:hypothetical protein
MARFDILPLLSVLIIGTSAVAVPALASTSKDLDFRVYLDDKPIGKHSFRITGSGEELQVTSRASFDVDFLFINAYRYRHESRELWRDGCLHRIQAETDDNGERSRVRGGLESGHFVVERDGAEEVRNDDCVMTFAYWNPELLNQDELLNPQTGELEKVRSRHGGAERIPVGDAELSAKRYRLEAEEVSIDLWYSDALGWVGLRSETPEGATIVYRRM